MYNQPRLIKCEWCGKNELTRESNNDILDFRFVTVYDKEHTICIDCYERLE